VTPWFHGSGAAAFFELGVIRQRGERSFGPPLLRSKFAPQHNRLRHVQPNGVDTGIVEADTREHEHRRGIRNLPERDQDAYRDHGQKLVAVARDLAIPIILAPPLSRGGLNPQINGGTGFVLQLPSGSFFAVTASHVLSGFEKRLQEGEVLNWQLGNLLPFDPIDRVAWRSAESDRDESLPPIEGGDRDCRDIVFSYDYSRKRFSV